MRQLLGQFVLVYLQGRNLACQYSRAPRHRLLLSSYLGRALVHLGYAPFGFACTVLPAANFGHRHGAAFAGLSNALVKRRQIGLTAHQQLPDGLTLCGQFLHQFSMM